MSLSLTVLNPATSSKAKGAKVELPAEVFDVPTNLSLIHQVVVAQLAAARRGTASTKTRGEVRGGGRKPYRQKGTGRARQGSTRAPQFAGGGVVHGPQPRGFEQRTPKKMKAAALRGALSDRARHDRLFVVSGLVSGDTPSTKDAAATLAKVSTAKNVLVVVERTDELTWKSIRNLPSVHVLEPGQLNTYDVLISDEVVFTKGALDEFLAGPATGKSAKGAASSGEADAQIEDSLIHIEDPGPPGSPDPKPTLKKTTKANEADEADEADEAPAIEVDEADETDQAAPAKAPAAKKAPAKKAAAEKAESPDAEPTKAAAKKAPAKKAVPKKAAAEQSDEETD